MNIISKQRAINIISNQLAINIVSKRMPVNIFIKKFLTSVVDSFLDIFDQAYNCFDISCNFLLFKESNFNRKRRFAG